MSTAADSLESDVDELMEAMAFEDALASDGSQGNVDTRVNVTAEPSSGPCPFKLVALTLNDGAFTGTTQTAALLAEIGGILSLDLFEIVRIILSAAGGESVLRMTELFYEKAFQDRHFSKFVADENHPHALRLGNWIIEKMTGEGEPWTAERVERAKCPVQVTLGTGEVHTVHDRSSAHKAAWNSAKRPARELGERFKLHDCRVWMRLMFWAGRESGVFVKSPSFAHWYIRFIKHFIAVYERSAPPYAEDEAMWSAYPQNIQRYLDDGCWMTDLLGPPRAI